MNHKYSISVLYDLLKIINYKCLWIHTYVATLCYICTYFICQLVTILGGTVQLLYFVWEDQRQKQYCICHKMSSVLYKNYGMAVTNRVQLHWLVRGEQAHCYACTWIFITWYMDLQSFLSTLIVICLPLCNKWSPLAMHLSAVIIIERRFTVMQ